jgi:hypothetical protein
LVAAVMPHEAFRVGGICRRENAGAGVLDGRRAAMMKVERGVHSDAGMAMLVVVPVVEFGAE